MSHHSGSVRICWTKITKFKGRFFVCTCLGFFPTFRLWAWCPGTGYAVCFFSRHFAVQHHLQPLCKHFKSIHGSMWCIADLALLLPHVLEPFYQWCFVSSYFCPRSWPRPGTGLGVDLPGSSCPTGPPVTAVWRHPSPWIATHAIHPSFGLGADAASLTAYHPFPCSVYILPLCLFCGWPRAMHALISPPHTFLCPEWWYVMVNQRKGSKKTPDWYRNKT